MDFIIRSECFHTALSDVNKAVSLKTPFPILSGIKITANEDSLVLIGSNSDIIIEKRIPLTIDGVQVLKVNQTGSMVLTATYLCEIVKKLPGDIHVKVTGNQIITLQSEEIVTRLNGFQGEEYPSLPEIDGTNHTKIAGVELMEMIKQTVFAVSRSEGRPLLTGVHMSFKENSLTFAATNSHRLALRERPIDSTFTGECIVPSTSLNEFIKLFHDETGFIHIYVTDRFMLFTSRTASLYSRLLEGNYPNVTGLIPKGAKTSIIIDTKRLLKGIDRACLFAREWKNNNVFVEITDEATLKISSNSSERGRIEETQPIKSIDGDRELSISLDGNFLMDALKAIKEEEVRLHFGGSMKPVLIEPVGHSSYLHLISPVRS
ncbi:DNA polymerase III subunit beta [Bacillus sp. RO3]|nr:DNA polymerase III subunit beta [Bacillus sp. RO3]